MKRRLLLWAAALTSYAVALFLLMHGATSVGWLLWGATAIAGALVTFRDARRRRLLVSLPTADRPLGQAMIDTLRHIRDTQGTVNAIRYLRSHRPSVPLKEARRQVEAL